MPRWCSIGTAAAIAVCAGADPAPAATKLCIYRISVVPESPSLIVGVRSLSDFEAEASDGTGLPHEVKALTDHYAWVTVKAADGVNFNARGLRRGCGFSRYRVSKDAPIDRRAPVVAATDFEQTPSVTFDGRPDLGWIKIEWAYHRGEIAAGRGAVEIHAVSRGRTSYSLDGPVQRRRVFLRIAFLVPDGTTTGVWDGWVGPGPNNFGRGRAAGLTRPPTRCVARSPWVSPGVRFSLRGRGQPRFRAVDDRDRSWPVAARWVDNRHSELEIDVVGRPKSRFWIEELPVGSRCFGPFLQSADHRDQRSIVPDGFTDRGDPGQPPTELRIELERPSLWWKMQLEWATERGALGTAKKISQGADGLFLGYGEELARDFEHLFVRIREVLPDGSLGPPWEAKLVRDPATSAIRVVP